MGAPIIPLLLRSFGRTGTTVVMQLLGTSPNVLFDRVYPFEHRLLAYAARLGMVASLPLRSRHPTSCSTPGRGYPPARFSHHRKRYR